MPFARTKLNAFFAAVKIALEECNNEGFVTIESLKHRPQFQSPGWVLALRNDSPFMRIVTCDVFKHQKSGNIDVETFLCYGLLLC